MNEFLYGILKGINTLTNNYGWAMVLFTILVRLVLTPFDVKSRVSMRKTTMLQPQLTALQKKYANDKEKLNQKTAELYKKEHINPLSSCLPLLLTYPILIAVFNAMRMMANEMTLNQVLQVAQNPAVMPAMDGWLWVKNLWMPDSPFAPALPDLGMLQQIPSDIWVKWFNANQDAILATDLGVLNLTADSFASGTLRATVLDDFGIFFDVRKGKLMSLRNIFGERHAECLKALRKRGQGDGYIVILVNFQVLLHKLPSFRLLR